MVTTDQEAGTEPLCRHEQIGAGLQWVPSEVGAARTTMADSGTASVSTPGVTRLAWLLLCRFSDLDLDPNVAEQMTEAEERMADTLALAISGPVTALALDMPKDLLARVIARELRRIIDPDVDPENTLEAAVASRLDQLADEWGSALPT